MSAQQRNCQKVDVFLIHADEPQEEKEFGAMTLKNELEKEGMTVITSETDIHGGQNLVTCIANAVQGSAKCLLVLSTSSHNSAWCTLNLLLALEKSHRLNTMSLVVLGIVDSEKWEFKLALEMLNTVPRINITSYNEIFEKKEKWKELIQLLKEDRSVEDVLPAGNIAHAQVWSHYTGFLHYVLPHIDEMIRSTQLYQGKENRFPLMMYELVPKTCNCPKVIEDIPSNPERRITLMEEKTGKHQYIHAGNTRIVDMPIYRVTDHDGTEYFCVLEIPFVLAGIQKMIQKRTPQKLQDIDIHMHVTRFHYTLAGILNHTNLKGTYHKARVIAYNENMSGFVLADEILKAVKMDLNPEQNMDASIPQEIPEDKLYDCFVFSHDGDDQVKHEIENFLMEKGLRLNESNRIGKSKLNFTEEVTNSRWTILILSTAALNDPYFSQCCYMFVGEFLQKERLAVIPVLTDAKYEDIPEAIRIVTYSYIAVDKSKAYLERILTTLKGQMIPYETQSLLPAGDVAYVLAWNYAVNYLVDVMPGLENVTKSLEKLHKDYKTCPRKLYLIIPKSCDCSKSLAEKDEKISFVITTPEAHIGHFGRKYTFDMYKLEYNGKEYLFLGQYPAPIACLRGMFDLKVAGINEQEMTSQVEKFCQEINTVLEHKMSEHFTDLCEIVFYDDRETALSEELARRLWTL